MHVFVYGTLTDPARVDAVLVGPSTGYDLEDPAALEGLHRVDGEYPTLAPGGSVEGRLLAVDEAALERLDRYEGVERGLYERVAVPRENPVADPVWTYVGDPARLGLEGITWPGDGPFRNRVRRTVDSRDIRITIRG